LKVYGNLQIEPQLGLRPLRRDRRSGLWEFWHIQTGARPEESADPDNPWVLTEDTGLVFVLIPGGTFWMGAQRDDPGGRNYDPSAEANESPVHEVTLAPFFLSKYEMTQGQWSRFTGRNPSLYGPSSKFGDQQHTLLHPVEQVSWLDCGRELGRLALVLPTEAQWEYAQRAGAETVWWTGEQVSTLQGAANLADRFCKANGGPASWVTEDEIDDGYVAHAPVGSFAANRFGMHDMTGNVWEWCRDGYTGYDEDIEDGDGLRKVVGTRDRALRGGAFSLPASHARSGNRHGSTPAHHDHSLGVRPALRVDQQSTLNSINNMGYLVNKLSRHAAAARFLLAGEAAARRVWSGGNAGSLGSYLAKLGGAHTGLGMYPDAGQTLLEAHDLLSAGFGEDHIRTANTVERLITLYETWHTAEPKQGHAAKVGGTESAAPLPPETRTSQGTAANAAAGRDAKDQIESTKPVERSAALPETIAGYRVLSVLGEGGMGVVYLAEQAKPIRRRVALKLIKVGMDTKQVIARFESERQALALMDHPGVAKVFDAGTTEQGRPFEVCEEPLAPGCVQRGCVMLLPDHASHT